MEKDPHAVAPQTPENAQAEGLAQRFRTRLLIFAMRWLRDRSAAEDAVQETLTRVTEALQANRIHDHTALPAFVYQTARHVCLQWRRKAGREHRALQRMATEPDQSTQLNPLTAIVGEERRLTVRQAFSELDTTERELLSLFYHKDLSTAEVAACLQLSPGAARVRKHRALKHLNEILERDETFCHERELNES